MNVTLLLKEGQSPSKISLIIVLAVHILENGNYGDVKKWMVENVHCLANLYDPVELVNKGKI